MIATRAERGRIAGGLAFVLACCTLAGRTDRAQELPITSYTTAAGLAHNNITRIVKDRDGFLWFCTDEGLSRFDGHVFTSFGVADGLPDPRVTDLLESPGGEFWVGTRGGLVYFNPRGRRGVAGGESSHSGVDALPMFVVIGSDSPAPLDITTLRQTRDGRIWVGTAEGLYRIVRGDTTRLQGIDIGLPNRHLEGRAIRDILEDRTGRLWIGTPGGLYQRFSDGRTRHYTTDDGLPGNDVQDLFESRSGSLWIGSRLSGFFRITVDDTGGALRADEHFAYPELPTWWVYQIAEMSDGRFVVATARGILWFPSERDVTRRQFTAVTGRQGLSSTDITSMVEDSRGNLWLGEKSTGAMRLAQSGLTSFGERDGLRAVNAIFEDNAGQVCYRGMVLGDYDRDLSAFEGAAIPFVSAEQHGFVSRLGCFDGRRFDAFRPLAIPMLNWSAGWAKERVTLRTRAGEWWVASGDGIYRFPPVERLQDLTTKRPTARYGVEQGLVGPQAYRLFEDARGDVWISIISGPQFGLARWDRNTDRIVGQEGAAGLPRVNVTLARAFAEDRAGHVWIGFNGELARYSEGRFRTFGAADSVPPGLIRDILVDRIGRLWFVSSTSGLVEVRDGGSDRPTFHATTTTDGLSSNNLEIIVEDLGGDLYVGGGSGVDRYHPETGRITHYSTADGLARGLLRAAFRDRSGELWFGTSEGLSRLTPRPSVNAAAGDAPRVWITGVRIAGVARAVSAVGELAIQLPDLAPTEGEIEVDFAGLELAPGEPLRYQVQLQGADANWSLPRPARTVTYAHLGPGRYEFLVRAVRADGETTTVPATMSFEIRRPVWQRWWFVSLLGLTLAFGAQRVYHYRVARLVEIANMRARIATDLHDDIGANLTRIALLSEVAAAKSGDASPASIARIARESIGSMSDIVWAINPSRDSLRDLARRMREHAEEVFTLREIELRFLAPEAPESLRLTMDVRRDLLLIFKEAVSNVARHSQCTRVDIQLSWSASQVVLRIADTGRGFDPYADHDGQGLASMRSRAKRRGGSLSIESSVAGTVLSVAMPLL